ncbi:MAG: sulfotransferase, partial [Acidimicrobiia bacterium]|nr:sulfotransferase [Acidimicrobiia bacterium]
STDLPARRTHHPRRRDPNPPSSAARRRAETMTPVLVAGHHRSGTSLLAQLLVEAGLFMGDRLMGATEANPHGHVEDLDVVEIHNQILADNGLTWQVDEEFIPVVNPDLEERIRALVELRRKQGRAWGVKDPRICLFLPLWKHIVPNARILITFRSPAASVDSMERRAARDLLERRGDPEQNWRFWTEPDHGARLWLVHNRALVRAARAYGDDVLVVDFDQLADDADVIAKLDKHWDLGLDHVRPAEVFDNSAVTAASRVLQVGDDGLAREIEDVWAELVELRS